MLISKLVLLFRHTAVKQRDRYAGLAKWATEGTQHAYACAGPLRTWLAVGPPARIFGSVVLTTFAAQAQVKTMQGSHAEEVLDTVKNP